MPALPSPPSARYTFTLPRLPRLIYETLQRLSRTHRLSQWHVVILALQMAGELEQTDKAKWEELAGRTRDTY